MDKDLKADEAPKLVEVRNRVMSKADKMANTSPPSCAPYIVEK